MDKIIEYDLDTSGGLMEKIQALIAPPQSSEESRRRCKKNSENHVRRGGKTINRDCCDACGEGGDLLCCDRCPASFHFACCDPPLEEDEIPDGEWLCNECRHGITQEEQQKKEKAEAGASDASSEASTDCIVIPRAKEQPKPFTLLAQMYKNRNPREFSLPPELEDFTVFPGDRKTRQSIESCNKNGKRDEEEFDKICFCCTRYDALSALAHCDFCPLSFHLDCLNPPLSQLPTGMWMCPNHPDNYEPGTRDPRYTLKVDRINELRNPVSHTAVKLDFIRKAKRSRILMNRERRKIRRTVIPKAIKAQYQCPPYQSLPDAIKEMQRPLPPHALPIKMPSKQEQDEWLKAIIDMQCEVAKEMSRPVLQRSTSEEASKSTKDSTVAGDDQSRENSSVDRKNLIDGGRTSPSVTSSPTNVGSTKISPTTAAMSSTGVSSKGGTGSKYSSASSGNSTAAKVIILATQAPFGAMKSSDVTSSQSAMSSLSSIASFASNQGKATLNVGKSSLSVPNLSGSHVISSVSSDTLQDPTLSLLDDRLVRVLAFQRLQQLTGQNKSSSNLSGSSSGLSSKRPEEMQEILMRSRPQGEAIASLSPVFGTQAPVPMVQKSLYIGVGADNTVCLAAFGHCNFTSAKHACIFYDEDAKQFELLNYSEHGTIVDNVLYSCDFTEKPNRNVTSSSAKYDEKKKFYNHKERRKRPPSSRTTFGSGHKTMTHPCNCRGSGSNVIYGGGGAGWEGTAVLHHGSYIKCGCVHFVFSVNECTTISLPRPVNQQKPVEIVKADVDVCG